MAGKHFSPIEADPEIFEQYAADLGRRDLVFQDLLEFGEYGSEMLLKPVVGLIVIIPLTDKILEWREDTYPPEDIPREKHSVWFRRQTLPNTCGTTSLLHLLNNVEIMKDDQTDWRDKEYQQDIMLTNKKAMDAAGALNKQMKKMHSKFQAKGASSIPPVGTKIESHFITFVAVNGTLYELDGSLTYPVNHGPVTRENFVQRVGEVIQEDFVAVDPDNIRFTAIAVSQKKPT